MNKFNITAILFFLATSFSYAQEISYINLNDSTLYCWKNDKMDSLVIMQISNGIIGNRENVIEPFFNIQKKHHADKDDKELWNQILRDSVVKQRCPDKVFQIMKIDTTIYGDKGFIWGIYHFDVGKSPEIFVIKENKSFRVDPIIAALYGEPIKIGNSEYSKILLKLTGSLNTNYTSQNNYWQLIREDLKEHLNNLDKKNELFEYIDKDGNNILVFIDRFKPSEYIKRSEIFIPVKIFEIVKGEKEIIIKYKTDLVKLIISYILGLITLIILALLFVRKIRCKFIQQKLIENLTKIVETIWKKSESELMAEFEKLYNVFSNKFEIYSDLQRKLRLTEKSTNDSDKAFQQFLTDHIYNIINNPEKIKILLEINNNHSIENKSNELGEKLKILKNDLEELSKIENFKKYINSVPIEEKVSPIEQIKLGIENLILLVEKKNNALYENKIKIEGLESNIINFDRNITNLNSMKDKLDDELNMYKMFYKNSYEMFKLLRKLDFLTTTFSLENQDWVEKERNSTVIYLLLLRSLLSLFFSKFTKANEKLQFNNLRLIINDDELSSLIDKIDKIKIDNELLFKQLPEENYYIAKSLFDKIYSSFNKEISQFPDPFYCSIVEDKFLGTIKK